MFDEIAAAGLAFFQAPGHLPFIACHLIHGRRTHASLDVAESATTTGSRAAAEVYDPLGAAGPITRFLPECMLTGSLDDYC